MNGTYGSENVSLRSRVKSRVKMCVVGNQLKIYIMDTILSFLVV
jgi:hypothetical protein